MNSLVRDHLPATYFPEYQMLRNELLDVLSDDDLAFQPGPAAVSLGALCREIGEIEHGYVGSFRTFRLRFDWHQQDVQVEQSIARLRTWFADLDGQLLAALEALSEEDVTGRRVLRDDFGVEDFAPLPAQNLDIYREALLIFYGKASIYLRLLGRELPGHWQAWIG